jgi:hypothetical protein
MQNPPETSLTIQNTEQWLDFIDDLFNHGILYWKKEYHTNHVLDGEQWELTLDFDGIPKFTTSGSNCYPFNWNGFKKVMKKHLNINAGGIKEFIEKLPAKR